MKRDRPLVALQVEIGKSLARRGPAEDFLLREPPAGGAKGRHTVGQLHVVDCHLAQTAHGEAQTGTVTASVSPSAGLGP